MSLSRYAEYKDSGVEWLGEVPGHWKISRLKTACEVFPSNVDKKSRRPTNRLCWDWIESTDVYYNEIIRVLNTSRSCTAATATYKRGTRFISARFRKRPVNLSSTKRLTILRLLPTCRTTCLV